MGSASRRPVGSAGDPAASRPVSSPDEIQVAFHPTLTRVWSHKGRRGQRLVEALGDNRHPSTTLACSTGARAGSLLVRSLLSEFKDHLYLVYTPAYDPDANRIEWLWRISRRVVTHHHHRSTFELLLADVEQHFQALAKTPAEVLRHIGSPFAPDKEHDVPLSLNQAA